MGELRAQDISKVHPGGGRALDKVSFTVRQGQVLTLLGPSGCGKTTLLRIVAGLDSATSGSLELDGEPLDRLPPGRRDVALVFQNYALYPHLTVAANMALTLEVRRVPRDEREERVRETADLLGITELLERRPGQLSGGQQQRVALGRALVRRPRLFLLDEPLSNLDATLRESMRRELKLVFQRLEATVLYVTHDQTEAMSLSDEVAVMREGRIVQCAPPLELYQRPADVYVAGFVGSPKMNLWRGRRSGTELVFGERASSVASSDGDELCVGIRPQDIEVADQPLSGAWPVELLVNEPLGPSSLLTLRGEGGIAVALAAPREWPERLWMRWPPDRVHWFDAASGRRLE